MHRPLLIALTVFAVLPGLVRAQTPPDGAAVFEKACASCHAQPAPGSRAPTREVLGQGAPEAILTALTTGNMFRQGSELTDAERIALFKTMYAYNGTYKVEGGKIVDSVDGAWNEGWVGTKFIIDKYEVSDKMLTTVSSPFKSPLDGSEIVVVITYDRVE